MKFKIDENLPRELAVILRDFNHDAYTVKEEGIDGWSDPEIGAVCKHEGRVLITTDLDFCDARVFPPSQFPDFVVLRINPQGRKSIIAAFRRVVPFFTDKALNGKLWIVDGNQIHVYPDE